MEKIGIENYSLIILLILIMVEGFLINGCLKNEKEILTPIDSPKIPARRFFMGVLPTTAQGKSFDGAYVQAAQYSEFVPVWGKPTPFFSMADEHSGKWGETFVTNLIRGNNMFPIIHLSFIGASMSLVTSPGIKNASLNNTKWRSEYKKTSLDVVKAIIPLYLSLGNEVNRWYEKYGLEGINGFKHFITLYEEIYDEVKKISPKTKVFCVFTREIISEHREANLDVLKLFDLSKMNLLVLTSYPYAVQSINNPYDIPDDYYSKVSDYMLDKPFCFTEIAWPSLDAFGGEEAQANFIELVANRLTCNQDIKLELFGWTWLHDLDQNNAIGLIRFDGAEELSLKKWKDL